MPARSDEPVGFDALRPEDAERELARIAERKKAAVLAGTEKRTYPADDPEPAIAAIAGHFREILRLVGEDPGRPGLRETPMRVARSYVELLSGYAELPADVMKTFPADGHGSMVIQRNIRFASLCEHHVLPFTGVAHIGYIPGDSIIGISKFKRILDVYARRLQVQERLTDQVADALMGQGAQGVVAVVEAHHSCMSLRGAKAPGSTTVTSALRGVLLNDPAARAEAMSLIRPGGVGSP